jgi:hypothetical protein
MPQPGDGFFLFVAPNRRADPSEQCPLLGDEYSPFEPTQKGCWAKFFSAKGNTEAASLPMTSLVSALGELRGCRCAQPIRPRRCVLIPAVGRKAKELALHCVDPGDIAATR